MRYKSWYLHNNQPEVPGVDSLAELTGSGKERLEKVRAAFGEKYVVAYVTLGGDVTEFVAFFADQTRAWEWIGIMLFGEGAGMIDVSLFSSRGVGLGEANNFWDTVTREEFHLRREEAFLASTQRGESSFRTPSPEEFLQSLPLAELNYLGLPQQGYNKEATAARVAELEARAVEVMIAREEELAKRKQ